jgi:transposase
MTTIQVSCRYCTSEQVIKNGSNKHDGHQRYRSQTCKRSFQLQYTYNAYLPAIKETIVRWP